MAEQKGYEVERRMNAAVTVEAGNGPGRWAEQESQEALARLDARLNPDHGWTGRGVLVDDDPARRLAEVNAFFEGHDSSVGDLEREADQATWGDIQPTPF
ncbi:MAG TPA: hypothetical protein VFW12_03775 [Candidatus Limnocylindria bacterium]|nr:hypothetical protein [Candidatus Limnocylindria bacterium]